MAKEFREKNAYSQWRRLYSKGGKRSTYVYPIEFILWPDISRAITHIALEYAFQLMPTYLLQD